ncbi:hypothetical protein M427DRAFT_130282 [Gonapodya prolifera JEL478]|uniref:SH3 domain-containing protein n=1 Tax=Gonapodya prolifera (strain JEL478) TaxID=1344416 RepID=A0A139AXQ7_GONPJ|nr:hypothetical protein M427DRAFT_130282 [Gonapodya prolifera JEL478]|eukprot:KXS21500.1 hypothetical protein M427DRAFT_130282 [Gonapodya prolifera JEL478]
MDSDSPDGQYPYGPERTPIEPPESEQFIPAGGFGLGPKLAGLGGGGSGYHPLSSSPHGWGVEGDSYTLHDFGGPGGGQSYSSSGGGGGFGGGQNYTTSANGGGGQNYTTNAHGGAGQNYATNAYGGGGQNYTTNTGGAGSPHSPMSSMGVGIGPATPTGLGGFGPGAHAFAHLPVQGAGAGGVDFGLASAGVVGAAALGRGLGAYGGAGGVAGRGGPGPPPQGFAQPAMPQMPAPAAPIMVNRTFLVVTVFEPEEADELMLQEGQHVHVNYLFADNWFAGRCVETGQSGYAPIVVLAPEGQSGRTTAAASSSAREIMRRVQSKHYSLGPHGLSEILDPAAISTTFHEETATSLEKMAGPPPPMSAESRTGTGASGGGLSVSTTARTRTPHKLGPSSRKSSVGSASVAPLSWIGDFVPTASIASYASSGGQSGGTAAYPRTMSRKAASLFTASVRYDSDARSALTVDTEDLNRTAEEADLSDPIKLYKSLGGSLDDSLGVVFEREMVVAYPYEADDDDELDLSIGEKIHVLRLLGDGWVFAENGEGDEGFAPLTHLRQ